MDDGGFNPRHCDTATLSSPSARVDSFAALGVGRDFLQIVKACQSPQIPSQLRDDLANEKDGARRLDTLCATLIATALRRCGVFADGQVPMSVDEICRRTHVPAGRRPQIRRLVDILLEDRWLIPEPNGFRWTGPPLPSAAQIAADASTLESDFPFAAGVGGLLIRCMTALPEVLSGQESPVAVLFASGSVTELEVFYTRFPLLALANAMVASAAAWIGERRDGQKLRVLEVGAGTGALTAASLPALAGCLDEYVYSDISPSFLAHGRRKFSRCDAWRPLVVDIDKDPAAQGLKDASFHLVLGSNVVHATPDVRRSIRHLRRALRPGGHLVLVETVRHSRIADCTVGLFDGWWSFRDSELREGYPLLGMRQWRELLREEGFHVAVVPVGDERESSPAHVAVLIAVKLAHDDLHDHSASHHP